MSSFYDEFDDWEEYQGCCNPFCWLCGYCGKDEFDTDPEELVGLQDEDL